MMAFVMPDAKPPPGATSRSAAARPAPPSSTAPTLALCRARDPVAFRAFVTRYQRPVFACLSRMLGRGPHVEDLAQEVFLRAFRAFPTFDLDATAKPSTWLLTIATRIALDARKRARHPDPPARRRRAASPSARHARDRARSRRAGAPHRARREQLPDDQRAAFVLAEYHGFTMTEIAAAMGIPEATAKTRLFRAREKHARRCSAKTGGTHDDRSGRLGGRRSPRATSPTA